MTENAVVKFDVDAAAKKMREQIRSAFVELLTPEQFEVAVKAEIHSFMTGKDTGSFQSLCRELFREEAKLAIKKELGSGSWVGLTQWLPDGSGGSKEVTMELGHHVKAWLSQNSQELMRVVVAELMGGAAQQVLRATQRGY